MPRELSVAVTLVLAGAAVCGATDVEIFGGLGVSFPRLDAVYDASYTPSRVVGIDQLFDERDPRSEAAQLLSLQGETAAGVAAGVNVYPTSRIGFQILFDWARLGLNGRNTPHEVSLTYDTIAFPSSERVQRTATFTFDQRDTEGRLEELSTSFDLAARFDVGRRVSGSVSGGLTYFRVHVEAEPLAAHAAWLGGHAVLFSQLYEMSYRTRPVGAFGVNLGGQLDIALRPHLALVVDGRWLAAPKVRASVELDEFLYMNVIPVMLGQVRSLLDLPPLEIDPSTARLLFGLKWKP